MKEQFRKVVGNDNYSISSNGRLLNKKGKEKVLQKKDDGYLKADLYKNGERSTKRIHRLVAEAFIPNPENKPDVNHKDGNKSNNSVYNLEWVNKSENMIHARDNGLLHPNPLRGDAHPRPMLGRKNPNASIANSRKVMIIETGEIFNSIKDCAIAIGGSDRAICECLYGRQRSHRGYHFERV